MKKFYFFIFFVFIFSVYLLVEDFLYIKRLKNTTLNKNIDSIVVLTGAKGRISSAMKFIIYPNIKYFIISGANPLSSRQDILTHYKNYISYFYKIIIENQSKNTVENALEAKKIIEKKRLKNVVIITSITHIKRSKFIFQKIFSSSKVNLQFYFIKEKVTLKKIIKERIKFFYDSIMLFFYY